MDYTLDTLIREWKVSKGLQPLLTDATVERQDAYDIDAYLHRQIDAWYNRLLDTAPLEHLVVDDITDTVLVTPRPGGVALMQLPDDCRRLVEVNMEGWHRPATIVTDPLSPLAVRQRCRWTRGGPCAPVAVARAGRQLMLYSFSGTTVPRATRILAVMTPPPGLYRLHPSALHLIPNT